MDLNLSNKKTQINNQSPEVRMKNFNEVCLGYSEEDAINLFEKLDSIQLYRNKNLIYTNTPFAWLLLYGDKVNDGLYEYPILKNTIVSIIEKERNQKKGELTIPNEIESISAGALHSLKYITKIVCGENLKVIGNMIDDKELADNFL